MAIAFFSVLEEIIFLVCTTSLIWFSSVLRLEEKEAKNVKKLEFKRYFSLRRRTLPEKTDFKTKKYYQR